MKNNKMKSIVFVLFLASTIFACKNTKYTGATEKNTSETIEIVDMHTAQNALDWNGTYSGVLPCADCEGIETELTLNKDFSYVLVSKYLGKGIALEDVVKGKFSWQGNNIKLEGIAANERSSMFKIEENQVRHLDMKGKQVKGDLAQYYVLRKNGNQNVEDKKWQLVELNGREISGKAATHFLIFNSKEARLTTKANCNVLSCSYKISNKFQLQIEPGLSTMMACEDNIEQEYFKVLYSADNFSTDGKSLSLNKAKMAPMARFILVKE